MPSLLTIDTSTARSAERDHAVPRLEECRRPGPREPPTPAAASSDAVIEIHWEWPSESRPRRSSPADNTGYRLRAVTGPRAAAQPFMAAWKIGWAPAYRVSRAPAVTGRWSTPTRPSRVPAPRAVDPPGGDRESGLPLDHRRQVTGTKPGGCRDATIGRPAGYWRSSRASEARFSRKPVSRTADSAHHRYGPPYWECTRSSGRTTVAHVAWQISLERRHQETPGSPAVSDEGDRVTRHRATDPRQRMIVSPIYQIMGERDKTAAAVVALRLESAKPSFPEKRWKDDAVAEPTSGGSV